MDRLFYGSYAALWVVVMVESLLLLLLYRHFGLMALGTADGIQRDGLAVGAAAPPLTGVTADGTHVSWSSESPAPTLLFFGSADCEPCARVLPYLNGLADRHDIRVVAVANGPQREAQRMAEKFDPAFLSFADDGTRAFSTYRVRVTPFAFVIGEDGRIRSKGLTSDPQRLRVLLEQGGSESAGRDIEIGREGAPIPIRPVSLSSNGNGNANHHPGSSPDSSDTSSSSPHPLTRLEP